MTVPDTLTGWCTPMEMLIGGRWQAARSERTEDVTSPFDGTVIGTVPVADVAGAVRAIREIDAGTVHINWTPLWRADLMPYGCPTAA